MPVTRRLEERAGSPLPGAGLLQERQLERVIGRGRDTLAIRVSRSFAEAAPFWQAFEAEGAAYANQTYAWCSTWQETIGRASNIQPRLVQVTSDEGRPAMLLPFGLRKRGGLGFLDFLDGWIADYNAPLLRPDFAATLTGPGFALLWQAILKQLPEVDVVKVDKIPAAIHGLPNPFLHLPCRQREECSHFARLDGDFAGFMRRCSANVRNDNRRKRRRLREKGSLHFRIATGEAEIAAIVAAMIRQKSRRYQETGAHDILQIPAYRDFFTTLAARHTGTGLTHVSALLVDDTIVATHIGMVFKDRYYWLMSGFEDGEWRIYSPGRVLLEYIVEWAYAQGLAVFDMTVGDEAYKQQWCDDTMPLYGYCAPVSRRGRLIYGPQLRLKQAIKASLWLHQLALKARRALEQ